MCQCICYKTNCKRKKNLVLNLDQLNKEELRLLLGPGANIESQKIRKRGS